MSNDNQKKTFVLKIKKKSKSKIEQVINDSDSLEDNNSNHSQELLDEIDNLDSNNLDNKVDLKLIDDLIANLDNNTKQVIKNNFNYFMEKIKNDSNHDEVVDDEVVDEEYNKLKRYYDEELNTDESTKKTSNDIPTPISCCEEMVNKIPKEFWNRKNLKIIDPCCGDGNFFVPILNKLMKKNDKKDILENILYFNDINEDRLNNVKKVYNNDKYNLNITKEDFLEKNYDTLFDLVVANPPFAKLLPNGKRASKNHNMIKEFINKSLEILKPGGYLLYITPDNWTSYADRNVLITQLTKLQIVYLNIKIAKGKYFKGVGSSFTWYLIENKPFYKDIEVEGIRNDKIYKALVPSRARNFIPLHYDKTINDIFYKTIENINLEKFNVETTSFLHKYTKREHINNDKTDEFKYKLIHTPKQTVYSNIKHKWQTGYKVFISTTDAYSTFIDNCGMTQSIAFIRCKSKKEATTFKKILDHELYKFLNDLCRWGNWNNIRILQSFPIPTDKKNIWNNFNLTDEEINYIKDFN